MVISARSLASAACLLTGACALGLLVPTLSACSSDSTDAGSGGGSGAGGSSSTGGDSGGNFANMPQSGSSTGGAVSGGTASGGGGAGVGGGGAGSGGNDSTAGSGGSGGSVPDVSPEGDGDITVGPDYVTDPNLKDQGKPKGKKFSFTMKSSDSLIFKGDDATLSKPWRMQGQTSFNRGITVYVPDQYKDGTEAPVLVIQDGPGPIDAISRALDNLTLATDPLQKLPPFVAVAVQNGSDRDGSDGQGSERGLEYDTMSDRYSKFIDTEVLPAVVANGEVKAAYPNLKFTKDPEGRGSFGCSSGGAAALSMGWFATNLWHRVVTYSGTFVDQQNHTQADAQMYPFGAWEYHSEMQLIKNQAPNKPLRIFLNANENDNGSTRDEASHHNWVMANQRTAAALKDKAYHYRYVFAKGLGHCAGEVQNQTIAEALSWAWRGYQAPK